MYNELRARMQKWYKYKYGVDNGLNKYYYYTYTNDGKEKELLSFLCAVCDVCGLQLYNDDNI